MTTAYYRHLLLAVDFEPESELVVARAEQMRRLLDARLTLLHVVEHVPAGMESMYLGYSGDMVLPDTATLEAELMTLAAGQMDVLAERLGVGPADRLIRVGSVGAVIDETAAELDVDLILIGSRGRHGWLGLFGSTARAVLRRSSCDVLCVRIADTSGSSAE